MNDCLVIDILCFGMSIHLYDLYGNPSLYCMTLIGVTVTIDVRHSRVMKRQYLNVLYSPTAAYKGHTEGLCGFMDNNAANDFMGPDGTLYKDAVQFAESCKQSC